VVVVRLKLRGIAEISGLGFLASFCLPSTQRAAIEPSPTRSMGASEMALTSTSFTWRQPPSLVIEGVPALAVGADRAGIVGVMAQFVLVFSMTMFIPWV